jgi:hypothetical protein
MKRLHGRSRAPGTRSGGPGKHLTAKKWRWSRVGEPTHEVAMAILIRFTPSGMTSEQYNAVGQKVQDGGQWPARGSAGATGREH